MDETDHGPGIPSAHDFQVPGRADYGQHEKVQPMLLHTLVECFIPQWVWSFPSVAQVDLQ